MCIINLTWSSIGGPALAQPFAICTTITTKPVTNFAIRRWQACFHFKLIEVCVRACNFQLHCIITFFLNLTDITQNKSTVQTALFMIRFYMSCTVNLEFSNETNRVIKIPRTYCMLKKYVKFKLKQILSQYSKSS